MAGQEVAGPGPRPILPLGVALCGPILPWWGQKSIPGPILQGALWGQAAVAQGHQGVPAGGNSLGDSQGMQAMAHTEPQTDGHGDLWTESGSTGL